MYGFHCAGVSSYYCWFVECFYHEKEFGQNDFAVSLEIIIFPLILLNMAYYFD